MIKESHEPQKKLKQTHNSIARGVLYLIIGAILFFFIPLMLLLFIQSRLSLHFFDLMVKVQVFGLASSIASFLVGFSQRNTRFHAVAGLTLIALICTYFWNLTNGGVIELSLQNIIVHLEFQLIVYWIIVIGIVLAVPYVVMFLNPKPARPSDSGREKKDKIK